MPRKSEIEKGGGRKSKDKNKKKERKKEKKKEKTH